MIETKDANGGIKSADKEARFIFLRPAIPAMVALVGFILIAWIKTNTWHQLERLQNDFAATRTEGFYLGLQLRGGLERLKSAMVRQMLSKSYADEGSVVTKELIGLRRLISRTKPLLVSAAERDQLRRVESNLETLASEGMELLAQGVKAVRRDSAIQAYQQVEQMSAPLTDSTEQLIRLQNQAWGAFLKESQLSAESLQRLSRLSIILLVVLIFSLAALSYVALILPLRVRLDATEAAVERQEKLVALGTLAAGVAHEIRNPLTAIKFRLFSLKKSLPAALRDEEDLRVIAGELNRLEKIVKDFLLFARPSEPEFIRVTAHQLLLETADLIRPQVEKYSMRLSVEPSENLWLKVDKQQIQQVLINLVQNAAESMENSGVITLSAVQGSARLHGNPSPVILIQVTDTGKGISPEIQKRLFDPFFSTKEGGTGLGLSISERIIEKHGGYLQFQTQPNRGTTFQIVLPCAHEHHAKITTH